MKIKPISSEKSLKDAKEGRYSFWVEPYMNKTEIKKSLSSVFAVNVLGISTINFKAGEKRTMQGKTVKIKARKKAIVTLKKGQKIDIFETEAKGGKK